MSKKKTALVVFMISILPLAGFSVWFVFLRYPSTLPLGQVPELILPLYDSSHNHFIQGFGQIHPDYYHNGFDFGVNDSTEFVAAFSAYVKEVHRNWYNERGGHWQTNVLLWINAEWMIDMAFESWALNATYGALQGSAINVTQGQYVAANQSLGNLLSHGDHAHVHFSIRSWGTDLCPYHYFTESAKAIFATQFACVNITAGWDM